MTKKRLSLEERLTAHPELKEQILQLLEIAESDSIHLADEAEERTIEGVHKLGKNVLEEWSQHQEQAHSDALESNEEVKRHGKKNSIG